MIKTLNLTFCLILSLALVACGNIRHPFSGSQPSDMSSQTLCYRLATDPNEGLAGEVAARNLDCSEVLENDPLLEDNRREGPPSQI